MGEPCVGEQNLFLGLAMLPHQTHPTTPGRRELAAVLFADMVGFSRRLEVDEIKNSLQTSRSINLFRSLIGDYGGSIANISGDGILALFSSADQAATFATEAMSEFRNQSVWSDGEPIEFRIGLNFGEVLHDNSNVLGHCVNIAARLQALAEPGCTLAAEAFCSALRNRNNISMRPMGKKKLRNISEEIEVFAFDNLGLTRRGAAPALRNRTTLRPANQPSVAVLRLDNMSGDPANDHLCDGIVEDVIANLSRFRNLLVIARHSAFMFARQTHSAREIGSNLGVRYLLSGSLRRSGAGYRISVDLVDTETEATVWNDRFVFDIESIFDIQDEIAAGVASRLAVQIDLAQHQQEGRIPADMRAYGLTLRGQQLLLKFAKESNAHARRLFEEAIEFAPSYGRAYSGISRTHNLDWRYSWTPEPDASLEAAVEFARQAIQRDQMDARGFAELGFAKLYQKRHAESLAEYTRALSLNPNDADIIAEYADALVYCEQPKKSVEMLEQAMRLNPYYPDWYLWYLADAYNALGLPEEVISTVQRMQNPDQGRRMLAANFAHIGNLEQARAEADLVMRLHPEFSISKWRERPPYRNLKVLNRYIEGLRKAGLPE